MKALKKTFFLILTFILLNLFIPNIKAIDTLTYYDKDYYLSKYDINIEVQENNTLDITENITAYFNEPKHGIIRYIPLKNNVTRLDGTKETNRVQISNVYVNDKSVASKENNNYKLQIGSKDKTVTGEKNYIIKYTYNLGKDKIKDYDELYYNLIGNDWDTSIDNITFTITMPKDFDQTKLGFSAGKEGSTDTSNITYSVKGNTITGSYLGVLNSKEGLTVRCELDEGYFVNAGLKVDKINYLFSFIPFVFLGIAILLWFKYGRDEQVVETVEFYPPEGFNSLEIGYLYKGQATNQDVTSLLIYLANKGYLKISETEEKTLFSKSQGFKLIKLKEYDGNNLNENIFFNGLFANNKTEVTFHDLYDKFYRTMNKIMSNINTKENKNKIFEKTASAKSIIITLMIMATFCLITIPPILNDWQLEILPFALLFPGLGFSVMFKLLFNNNDNTIYINGKATHSSIALKVFALVWGLTFGGMPWLFLVLPSLLQLPIYLINYIIGLICILGMLICQKYLPKRTKYGREILGKIQGFKNYLETVEKDKLEAMVTKDPTYFYNILPYTYVLGISDTWIKKFETISIQEPYWYSSFNTFDMITFATFMNSTMSSAQSAMVSSPSSSSGGFSGGGFSGGGSGGGGGSSW